MSRELKWFLSGVYSAFDVSGQTTKIKKRSKSAGTFSSGVSTNSRRNLSKSSAKVGNALRESSSAAV